MHQLGSSPLSRCAVHLLLSYPHENTISCVKEVDFVLSRKFPRPSMRTALDAHGSKEVGLGILQRGSRRRRYPVTGIPALPGTETTHR